MRSTLDRIRHAVSFEIIGLALIIPLGAWVFALPSEHMGVIGVGSAVVAMAWNYVYNLGFDHVLLRLQGDARKTPPQRILHAVLFEAGLLAILAPMIALYLEISVLEAVLIDIYLAVFYVVYALAFNWAYDWLFPIPRPDAAAEKEYA